MGFWSWRCPWLERACESRRSGQSFAAASEKNRTAVPKRVFHPQPKDAAPRVYREGNVYVVVSPELERIVAGTGVDSLEARGQLKKQFARLGVSKALEKAGTRAGDKVRCGDIEWEW